MPITYQSKNSYKTESGNNTLTIDNVEVPESTGAKRVHIIRVEMDVSLPTYVAASTTAVNAVLIGGKVTPSVCTIAEPGAITTKAVIIVSTGAAGLGVVIEGPNQAQGHWEIFRDSRDGKYYFTVAVVGTANTATKTVCYRVDFEIET